MSLSLYRHFSAVIGQAKQGKAHLTDHEVCIGSCTRGRLEDLAIAGEIASVRGWASHFRGTEEALAAALLAAAAATALLN